MSFADIEVDLTKKMDKILSVQQVIDMLNELPDEDKKKKLFLSDGGGNTSGVFEDDPNYSIISPDHLLNVKKGLTFDSENEDGRKEAGENPEKVVLMFFDHLVNL